MTKHTKSKGDHLVAGGEGVGESRFPPTGTRAGEDKGGAMLGVEDVLGVFEDGLEPGGKPGISVVGRGHCHGTLDLVVDVDGSRYKQVVAARWGVAKVCCALGDGDICKLWEDDRGVGQGVCQRVFGAPRALSHVCLFATT